MSKVSEEKQRDLEKLRQMAMNFDEEERQTVLSAMPINELIDSLKRKCDIMLEKLDHVQTLVDKFTK